MPTVTVQGKTSTCDYGVNLRRVLLEHKIDLYNGKSTIINCRDVGNLVTGAVKQV